MIQAQPQREEITAAKSRNRKKLRFLVALVVISLMVVCLLIGLLINRADKSYATVMKNTYQAVFLTNGQAYFGKIQNNNARYVELTDVYYYQLPATAQQGSSNEPKDQKLSLVHLGSELHGPQSTMYINTQQVLFWENLKDDSQVVRAIQNRGKN